MALIDSSINQCEFDACYMTDNVNAGQMAAKEMLGLLKEAGNLPSEELEVGIMLSSDTSQAMINRVSGFLVILVWAFTGKMGDCTGHLLKWR